MNEGRSKFQSMRGGLVSPTGKSLSSQDKNSVRVGGNIPDASCVVKAPNGDIGIFPKFAVYGVAAEGTMAMAYCDLVELNTGIKALQAIYDEGFATLLPAQQEDVKARITLEEDRLYEVRGAAKDNKEK